VQAIEEISERLMSQGYAVASGLLSAELCDFATDLMRLSAAVGKMPPHKDVDDSGILAYEEYAPLFGETLLRRSVPLVEGVMHSEVWPSYSYWRIYHHGSRLKRHIDRPSCEVSMSVHLGGDQPWPLWVRSRSGEEIALELAPGDGLFYQGCEIPHWRETYEGREYFQVFLHYVKKDGPRAPHKFDGRISLGLPQEHRIMDLLRQRTSRVEPPPAQR
jgi:hypothetical protein